MPKKVRQAEGNRQQPASRNRRPILSDERAGSRRTLRDPERRNAVAPIPSHSAIAVTELQEHSMLKLMELPNAHSLLVETQVKRLYKQVSALPNFKDKTDWNENASIYEVFAWLLREGQRHVSDKHNIVQLKNGRLVERYPIFEYDGMVKCPVSWLPCIRQKYPDLHEYAVGMIGMLMNKSEIFGYHDCLRHGVTMEFISESMHEMSEDEAIPYREAMEFYTIGPARTYSELFRAVKKMPDPIRRPRDVEARALYDWLRKGEGLIVQDEKLTDYLLPYEDLDGSEYDPDGGDLVKISEGYGFVWSADSDSDTMYKTYCDWIDDMANNYGSLPPFGTLDIGQKCPKASDSFPGQVWKFLREGFDLVNRMMRMELLNELTHEHSASLDLVCAE